MDQHPDCIAQAGRWQSTLTGLAWTALIVGAAAAALAMLWPAIGFKDLGLERAWLGLAAGAAWAVAAAAFPAVLIVARRRALAGVAQVHGSADPQAHGSPSPDDDVVPLPGTIATADHAAPAAPAQQPADDQPGAATTPTPPPDPVADLLVAAGWPQLLRLAPWAALAGAIALITWTADGGARLGMGIAALIAAFPVLLAERRFANVSAAHLPEAAGLARLLRVAVAVGVAGGVALVLVALDITPARWLLLGLLVLVLLTAVELVLRGLVAPFLPVGAAGEARGLGDSLAAGVLLQRQAPWRALTDGMRQRFGIDLAQSWAVAFLARAAVPLGGVLLALAWLSSGVTSLAIDQRGVYERLGAPAAVLAPGLHVHLPWPMGAVRRVDNGAVHLLGLTDDEEVALVAPVAAVLSVSGQPGAEWDRLWEIKHARDAVHLVPAPAEHGGRAGHHLINADVGLTWRWRLDDGGALAACYAVASPRTLMTARANRLLASEFSSLPVAKLIAEDREALAGRLHASLQAGLDADRTGIEVLDVLIDAIHPPADASIAYHRVQSAEILAEADVARARSERAALTADAGREAIVVHDNAVADGGEARARARSGALRFAADAAADAAGGRAWRLERWLQMLTDRGRHGRLLIIDHRLDTTVPPTIDLRRILSQTATSTD